MANVNWKTFWQSYRQKKIASEADLFFEVGKTVNQLPISEKAFTLSIDLIRSGLEISARDRLLDLCCGNGLMTRRLASLVNEIRAVDFAEHLVANARQFSTAENVAYVCADAIPYLQYLVETREFVPTKILLGDALCYFEPAQLRQILESSRSLTRSHFVFMATGIPCDELKWNFYNTPKRVKRYGENQKLCCNTNDGIGRWWSRKELESVGQVLNLGVTVTDQPGMLSDFRVNAIFRSRE
jgi:SAM-dependent methyltransferase